VWSRTRRNYVLGVLAREGITWWTPVLPLQPVGSLREHPLLPRRRPSAGRHGPLWLSKGEIRSRAISLFNPLSVDDAALHTRLRRRKAIIATLFSCPSTAMKKPAVAVRAGSEKEASSRSVG